MNQRTPGLRIGFLRDQRRISEAELGRLVGLQEQTIVSIERGTKPIEELTRSFVDRIAEVLGVSPDYILEENAPSEKETHEALLDLRKEGLIEDEDECLRLDELAIKTMRLRSNARIPLSRSELLRLLEVIRGSDGYQLRLE